MNSLLPEGIALIKSNESCRLTAYLDETGRVWTIGWGHTGPDVHEGLIWNQDLADSVFESDLSSVEVALNNLLGPIQLTDHQYSALLSFAYNIGIEAFEGSVVFHYLKAGIFDRIPFLMERWNKIHKANGLLVVSKILINRRSKEIAFWSLPDENLSVC